MAINPKIKERAEKIRKEVYGKDVREALASGLEVMSEDVEETKNRQDNVESQFQNVESQFQSVLDETTGKDVISAPEITAARVGADGTQHSNLKQRLDSEHDKITAQLAQIEEKFHSLENANARSRISFLNYLGDDENIHPKVLSFANKWNGYTYWLAYSPYKNNKIENENPCIAVSNDMIHWTIPNGLTNPIEPAPNTGTGDTEYNSDPHLVFRNDINTLEIWWRYYNQTSNYSILYRKKSTDGVNWGEKELVWDSRTYGFDVASPAVIFEDGKYKMWGLGRGGSYTNNWVYAESTDAKIWSNIKKCDIPWGNLVPWHGDVIKTDLGYEHVISAYDKDTGAYNLADLYYVQSPDNITFSEPVKIIERSKNPSALDSGTLYRSSLLKIDGMYYVFYSAKSKDGRWSLTLSYGKDIRALNGYFNVNMLNLSEVLEIIFDNRLSYIRKNRLKLSETTSRAFLLQVDPNISRTVQVADPAENGLSGGLRVGMLFFDKSTEHNVSQNKDGAVRYNPNNKKLEFYDGGWWNALDKYVRDSPPTFDSPGVRGEYAANSKYLYICYSTNRWGRIPLETGWTD